MSRTDARQADPGTLAVLHRAGYNWRGIIAATRGAGPRLVDAAEFTPEQFGGIEPWIRKNRASEVLVVLPASAVVCRTSSLPMADPEQLEEALQLQLEAGLQGTAPEHRSACAVLPAAQGETSRTGIMVAWPEQAAFSGPPVSGRYSHVPDIASVAALLNGQRPTEPLLWVDRSDGSVALALTHASGAALRAMRESLHGDDWMMAVGRVVAETGLDVGHSPSFLQATVDRLESELTTDDADPAHLVLPAETVEAATARLEDSPADHEWWARYGICAGAVLARTNHLAALTRLQAAAPAVRPSRIAGALHRLTQPRTALAVTALCLAVLALGPLAMNGLRWKVLEWRHADLDQQVAAVEQADQLGTIYRDLADRRWTMTKLLADLACNTPRGIELDSIRIDHNDAISVNGTARPDEANDVSPQQLLTTMQSLLQRSGIIGDVSMDWDKSDNFGNYEFRLTARVSHPHRRVDYTIDQDYGRWTMLQRLSGDPAPGEDEVLATAIDDVDEPAVETDGDLPAEDLLVMAESTTPPRAPIESGPGPDAGVPVDETLLKPEDRMVPPNNRGGGPPPPRGSGGGSDRDDGAQSRERGDRPGMGGDLPPSENPPEPLTAEQVDSMTKAEAREMLSRVSRWRRIARASDDADLGDRLKQDWTLLLERIKKD